MQEEYYIEDVILQFSGRGMDILRRYLPCNYCLDAVEALLSLDRGYIFIVTGFYVDGYAETDGPLGTYFLAGALEKLGFKPVIITDNYCMDFFEGYAIEYFDISSDEVNFKELLQKYKPKAIISIERCGINSKDDYANMRGESIALYTPKLDILFRLAKDHRILTIGIGDGGNEIGMGNIADIIKSELSILPCVVNVEYLIIATVSNWGAYGIIGYLEITTRHKLLPSYMEVKGYLEKIVKMGCIDGVTKRHEATVDGFDISKEDKILSGISAIITRTNTTNTPKDTT